MKIALCTTTIHIPHALKLMRKCDSNVRFFVASDVHTPYEAIRFCNDLPNTVVVGGEERESKTKKAVGLRTLARRNLAFLEALHWGADVIYSWDNDNLPVDREHFKHIISPFKTAMVFEEKHQWNGIKVTGCNGWFDPGQLLIPPTRHRGFPYDKPVSKQASPITNAKVGVAAGLVIGDPDIDATTRIERRPDVGSVHVLGSTGIVVLPGTWTVFNSQNTAVIRELIPAWFMMPGVGRHDDIYASLIVQRVARERGYHVHFGPPFTYQQRNDHNLVTDLRAEIDGMENVQKMAAALDAFRLKAGASVVDHTRALYIYLASIPLIPDQAFRAAMAWLEDCEEVL
jgi:hypothetical protein